MAPEGRRATPAAQRAGPQANAVRLSAALDGGGAGGGARSAPDLQEVLAAIETLYADEVKPYGRILRKRLKERSATVTASSLTTNIDMSLLRALCASCPWLRVQDEDAGDWTALWLGRPDTFIDIYSQEDTYPKELWEDAALYFERLDSAEMVLPGGRYSCAQALAARNLPFLANRSLGQICHIVQLALSQKKLLGHLNGSVVPYAQSNSMLKERCAEAQCPCAPTGRSLVEALATWETLADGLMQLLGQLPQEEALPLSNVKRLFRSRFHMELSETALGYSKLSDLLQDARLQGVCAVKLQRHGYMLVRPTKRSGRSKICLAESLPPSCVEETSPALETDGSSSWLSRINSTSSSSVDGACGSNVNSLLCSGHGQSPLPLELLDQSCGSSAVVPPRNVKTLSLSDMLFTDGAVGGMTSVASGPPSADELEKESDSFAGSCTGALVLDGSPAASPGALMMLDNSPAASRGIRTIDNSPAASPGTPSYRGAYFGETPSVWNDTFEVDFGPFSDSPIAPFLESPIALNFDDAPPAAAPEEEAELQRQCSGSLTSRSSQKTPGAGSPLRRVRVVLPETAVTCAEEVQKGPELSPTLLGSSPALGIKNTFLHAGPEPVTPWAGLDPVSRAKSAPIFKNFL